VSDSTSWDETTPVGFDPFDVSVGIAFQSPALLVQHPVMSGAELDQVVEVGQPSGRPETDVVAVYPPTVVTARKMASLIAASKAPSEPSRDASPGPTDSDNGAVLVFGDDLDPAVTGQFANRLDR
jgi:hypothetical protein